MGLSDGALGRYMEDDARFADLLNGYFFHGRQIVKAEDIKERDPRVSGKSKRKSVQRKLKTIYYQKTRDIVRRVIYGIGVSVVGLEYQAMIHYGTPVRTMIEDSLEYGRQFSEIQRRHRNAQDLKKPAEYVGQFSVEDRLIPATSIVLYFGKEEWDGPRDLLDVLKMEGIPDEIRSMIHGYPLNLLEVRKFKSIDYFVTDLREVFGIIQNSDEPEQMKKFAKENEERLSNLAEDAFDVISAITGNEELIERKGELMNGERVNLGKVWKDWSDEERKKGEKEKAKTVAGNAFRLGIEVEKVAALCEESVENVKEWFQEWDFARANVSDE